MSLAPGTKLDGYEILSLLGAGGMGEVYRARDAALRRDVAIKVLPGFIAQDADRLRRFTQEAQAAAALNHPNILAVYGLGSFGGAPYLVSELLDGETLREMLSHGVVPIRKASDYAAQIARGLAAAHEKGIVHRDLKPENLFVARDGRIKILDFGLAKLMHTETQADDSTATRTIATNPGVVMGTAGYMSPELVRGKPADHRTDIFALGVILYEMVAGRRVFEKATSAETMTAILNEDPPSLSQIAPGISPGMQRVIHRCLEKAPEQRFQSASDLAFALEALSEPGSGPAIAIPPRPRVSWPSLAACSVVVGAAAAFAAWWWIPPAVPMVESVVQLTGDPKPKDHLFTDGSRIYFDEGRPSRNLAQVSIKGGPSVPIETKLENPFLAGLARDGSALLVQALPANMNEGFLWSIPLPGGEPSRLGSTSVADVDVFPDGRLALVSGNDVLLAESNGSDPGKLISIPGSYAERLAVSPDGKHILLQSGPNNDLMEIAVDGGEIRTLRKGNPDECCFRWSGDGNYLLYSARAGFRWDLWALPLRGRLLRRLAKPIRLTQGPESFMQGAIPSRDQKQIFAVGSKQRGEAVRFDLQTHLFLPVLSGISATDLTYSRDGKWVAYSSYPDHTLWRSRSDGTDTLQLTYPPMEAHEPFISPDGTRVLFGDLAGFSIRIVDMGGGPSKTIAENAGGARWSPDGKSVVAESQDTDGSVGLSIIDVSTGKKSAIPSTKTRLGPFWLDNSVLGAADPDLKRLAIFDLRTREWTDILMGISKIGSTPRMANTCISLPGVPSLEFCACGLQIVKLNPSPA